MAKLSIMLPRVFGTKLIEFSIQRNELNRLTLNEGKNVCRTGLELTSRIS